MHSVVVLEMPGGTDRRRSLVKRAFSDGKSKRKGPKLFPEIKPKLLWSCTWFPFIQQKVWPTILCYSFSGESRDILIKQSRLAQFWQDLWGKTLVLVNPTDLEIFWQDLLRKVLVLANTTELKSNHFKKTVAQFSFLSKVLSFWFQQKWQHFWKKWGLLNRLLKMNGL